MKLLELWPQSNDFGHGSYRKFAGVRGWRAKMHVSIASTPLEHTNKTGSDHAHFVVLAATACHAFF